MSDNVLCSGPDVSGMLRDPWVRNDAVDVRDNLVDRRLHQEVLRLQCADEGEPAGSSNPVEQQVSVPVANEVQWRRHDGPQHDDGKAEELHPDSKPESGLVVSRVNVFEHGLASALKRLANREDRQNKRPSIVDGVEEGKEHKGEQREYEPGKHKEVSECKQYVWGRWVL